MTALATSGLADAAAEATGVVPRADEDIMVARTAVASSEFSAPDELPGRLLNVHHDRHKSEHRVASTRRPTRRRPCAYSPPVPRVAAFMVYLTTLAAGEGGETFFPVAGSPADDALVKALSAEYEAGSRFLPSTSRVAADCDERLRAWRRGSTSDGVGVLPSAGTALVFDAAGADGPTGAWHGPAAVYGPNEKVTLTFFKRPPPLWSPVLFD
jgi:hypothetical protein